MTAPQAAYCVPRYLQDLASTFRSPLMRYEQLPMKPCAPWHPCGLQAACLRRTGVAQGDHHIFAEYHAFAGLFLPQWMSGKAIVSVDCVMLLLRSRSGIQQTDVDNASSV